MVDASYKFRFDPTLEQESLLRRTLGCVRLVYNKALAARTQAWYENKERVSYKQSSTMLTSWKKQENLGFLTEVSSVPLQQDLRDLQTVFPRSCYANTNFFSGLTKYRNFKKKRNGGSAEFTKAGFRWKDGQVYLAKCGEPLPIRWSRQLPQNCVPSTIIVKLEPSGRWSVSLRVDDTRDLKLKLLKKQVGIDLGIKCLLTTSDGEKVANPKNIQKLYKKLRLAQKSLYRKTKGTNNYQKARLKVARIHAKIKDSRIDYTHKLTTQLIRENQIIVVEDLSVKNMVKNHNPPPSPPGRGARGVGDANWGEIVRQLEYKAQWYGRKLVKIDRYFPSSKGCSNCGHVVEKLPISIREWDCRIGSSHYDKDINAAINILAAGLPVSVCGATVRPEESKSWRAGAMRQKTPNSNARKSRPVSSEQRREDVISVISYQLSVNS